MTNDCIIFLYLCPNEYEVPVSKWGKYPYDFQNDEQCPNDNLGRGQSEDTVGLIVVHDHWPLDGPPDP